jgi:hypothetical protein
MILHGPEKRVVLVNFHIRETGAAYTEGKLEEVLLVDRIVCRIHIGHTFARNLGSSLASTPSILRALRGTRDLLLELS